LLPQLILRLPDVEALAIVSWDVRDAKAMDDMWTNVVTSDLIAKRPMLFRRLILSSYTRTAQQLIHVVLAPAGQSVSHPINDAEVLDWMGQSPDRWKRALSTASSTGLKPERMLALRLQPGFPYEMNAIFEDVLIRLLGSSASAARLAAKIPWDRLEQRAPLLCAKLARSLAEIGSPTVLKTLLDTVHPTLLLQLSLACNLRAGTVHERFSQDQLDLLIERLNAAGDRAPSAYDKSMLWAQRQRMLRYQRQYRREVA
jgi:hypothetical protein